MSDRYTPEPDKYRKNSPTGPGQEYTPTEAEMREASISTFGDPHDEGAAFDRGMARIKAQVRAVERAKRPDREQIAQVLYRFTYGEVGGVWQRESARIQGTYLARADAVLALEPEAREEQVEDEPDPSLDDCPACDAALSDCAPDAACCEDCSHVHNWPAPEAREVTDAIVDIADEVYGDELTRALREDLGQTVGNVRRHAMRAALEAAAAVTDG